MAEVSDEQLANLGIKLERISIRVNSFGSSLATISNQLSQASSLERMKEKQEQDRERILAEQALREGKESVFERKMQNALVAPMQKVAGPAMSALDRLQNFFLALGASWLTGRIFSAIKAAQEGNKSKLEEIKGNILTGLRRVLLVFTLARFGISRAIRAIMGVGGAIMNGIYTGLIRKPFVALMNAIRRASASAANTVGRLFGRAPRSPLPRQPQPRTPGRPGRPGRPGTASPLGNIFTGISGAMNFLNGENVDAALAALSFIPGKGVIFKGVRMLAAAAFTADDVMEAFGGNLTGADPKELARVKRDAQAMIDANQPAQADTSSNVQPTDNLMGGSSTDSSKEDGVEANTSQANFQSEDATQPADVSPSGSQEPPAAQISSSSSSSTSSSQVGPTPKPEPQVNIIPQSSNPQSVPAEGGAQASKIPNIPSSNIDNFYTLYSQVNYNVVT
tara:strand:+ start:60 stop:1412 length:1353 start_codon:yes stop_codon:yes gene_type:complete